MARAYDEHPDNNGGATVKRGSIDSTGTTKEERRRIRAKVRKEKMSAKRGIRSMAATDKYRKGFDEVFGKPKTIPRAVAKTCRGEHPCGWDENEDYVCHCDGQKDMFE